MRTRALTLAFALIATFTLAGCETMNTVSAWLGNKVAFGEPQLQRHLDHNFPREFDKLGGLVSIRLMNPRLSIPPNDNRLRVDFDLGIGALGSDSRTPSGRFALVSALRYDPQTRGLHLQNPAVEYVDVPALGGTMNSTARGLLNSWLVDYARTEPVYRFDNSLLDRLGARRIGRTDISNGQVVVRLDE
mgnify:CR=1 FL=1